MGWLEPWWSTENQPPEFHEGFRKQLEFEVSPGYVIGPFERTTAHLTDIDKRDYYFYMSHQFIIEERQGDPELTRLFDLTEHNARWFSDHAQELDVFELYRGRFVAASEGEIFVGDSSDEVEELASAKHPNDIPHIQYIPFEKTSRIYAC